MRKMSQGEVTKWIAHCTSFDTSTFLCLALWKGLIFHWCSVILGSESHRQAAVIVGSKIWVWCYLRISTVWALGLHQRPLKLTLHSSLFNLSGRDGFDTVLVFWGEKRNINLSGNSLSHGLYEKMCAQVTLALWSNCKLTALWVWYSSQCLECIFISPLSCEIMRSR